MNDNNVKPVFQPSFKPKFKKNFINNYNKFKGQYAKNKPNKYSNNNNPNNNPNNKLKRTHSADNLKTYPKPYTNQHAEQPPEQPSASLSKGEVRSIVEHGLETYSDKLMPKVSALIELKTKYYVDQRINVLENSNDLLTRGSNELSIAEDPVHAGMSWMFKYNGDSVARITDSGILYCRNLWVNGINIVSAINSMMNTESNTLISLSEYVKHSDLKDGMYIMDIDTATMKHLNVIADDKNTLEFKPQYNSAMLISTDRSTGIQLFNPNIVAAGNFTALAFGTANNQDEYGVLRYYNNATTANRYIGIGMNTSTNCLSIYQDKRVVINTANNIDQCLLCKYNGNLSNNKYLRIGCGDNRDTGIFAYGRNSNENYLYLKLQGRSAEIDVYANYTLLYNQNFY